MLEMIQFKGTRKKKIYIYIYIYVEEDLKITLIEVVKKDCQVRDRKYDFG